MNPNSENQTLSLKLHQTCPFPFVVFLISTIYDKTNIKALQNCHGSLSSFNVKGIFCGHISAVSKRCLIIILYIAEMLYHYFSYITRYINLMYCYLRNLFTKTSFCKLDSMTFIRYFIRFHFPIMVLNQPSVRP